MLGLSISCYYGAEKHGPLSVVCLQCGQVAAFNIVNSSIDRFSFNFTMNIQRLQFILHYELYNFHKDYIFHWMQLYWKSAISRQNQNCYWWHGCSRVWFLLRGRRCWADNTEVPFILISLFSTQENFILPRQENSDSARAITSFSW